MKKKFLKWIPILLAAALIAALFLCALKRLDENRVDLGREQLELALRRAAVTCYAAEGCYPETASYLYEHYGIQYDESQYTVHYEAIASNLMPDITVVVNAHEE
ncbi:MAG: hypothetical protein E7449_07135 [Ruminococcaceae bacterium]|nr:hypothetical protein [Oscillospiraceae bacterium]